MAENADANISPMMKLKIPVHNRSTYGSEHRERRNAQDGKPDDALAAHAIADRPAEERAESRGEQEIEQVQLGRSAPTR